ncbi:MAG: hypothetical protein P8X55_14260 [Desulfosarcinaceae bacterium]
MDIGPHPYHTHIVVLMFITFRKVYPYSWNLKELSKKTIIEKLENAGFDAVDMETLGYQYGSVSDLVREKGDTWQINPEKNTTAQKLINDQHLQAILIVKEMSVPAAISGVSPSGETVYLSVNGSGLYSTFTFGGSNGIASTKYKAIAGVHLTLLSLSPPADLSLYPPLQVQDQLYIRSVNIDESLYPKDRKDVTQEEFEKILPNVLTCMGGLADTAICAITAGDKSGCYNNVLERIQKSGSGAGD